MCETKSTTTKRILSPRLQYFTDNASNDSSSNKNNQGLIMQRARAPAPMVVPQQETHRTVNVCTMDQQEECPEDNNIASRNNIKTKVTQTLGESLVVLDDDDFTSYPCSLLLPSLPGSLHEEEHVHEPSRKERMMMKRSMTIAPSNGEGSDSTMSVLIPAVDEELKYQRLGETQCGRSSTLIHIPRRYDRCDHENNHHQDHHRPRNGVYGSSSSSSSLTDSYCDSFSFLSAGGSSRHFHSNHYPSSHDHQDGDEEKEDEETEQGLPLSSSQEESAMLSLSSWFLGDHNDEKFDERSTTNRHDDTWLEGTQGQEFMMMEPYCVPYAQLCFDPQSNDLVTLMEISVTSKMGTRSKRLCVIHSYKEGEKEQDDYEDNHPHERRKDGGTMTDPTNDCSRTDCSSTASSARSSTSSYDDEAMFPLFPSAPPDSPKVKERYDEPIVLSTINYQDSWWEETDLGLYLLHECQDPWELTKKDDCGCSEAVKKLLTVSKCLIYRTKNGGRDCSIDWKSSPQPFAGLAYCFLSDV